MNFWKNKRLMVTGGHGFLGSHVVEKLRELGCDEIIIPTRKDHDLSEKKNVIDLYKRYSPDIVIHLAAVVGGIAANQRHPGRFLYENAVMGLELVEQARHYGVEKFVCVGTVCSYPKLCSLPFKEDDLWKGYPEEITAPYGLAKRLILAQLAAYRQEYGLKSAYLILVNLYGPRDNFEPERSHVVPALIRRCIEAKERRELLLTVWGSGRATREFLYVEDAAEAILMAAEKYDSPLPVNIGSGQETRVAELVSTIQELVGYPGKIVWDPTKPDGQPRRCLDTTRAWMDFSWRAETPLREGLRKTIKWFQENYHQCGSLLKSP